jgi:DNA-binding MarR family transcriptional regulator
MTDTARREALAHDCAGVAHRLMATLARKDAPAWLDLDITMAQLKALMAIATRGPLMVGALGRALGITEPSASLLVDRLEEQGLAQRRIDPADRRRTLVLPTVAATDLLERLQQGRREAFVALVADLSDDELAALNLGVNALARAADAQGGR